MLRCCKWQAHSLGLAAATVHKEKGFRLASMTSRVAPSQAVDFFLLINHLKTNKRTGWVRMGISGAESIADHMYRMALMAMVGAPACPGLDVDRCVKMALVHDAPEALVGDITPHCGISKQEKHQMEKEAIERIKGILGASTAAGCEVEEIWWEYEGASTPEAQLVKDIDKLELIIQATHYEQTQGKDLQEFFDSTAGKFKTPLGQQWSAEVLRRRQALHALSAPSQSSAGQLGTSSQQAEVQAASEQDTACLDSMPSPFVAVSFFELVQMLKDNKRTGWVRQHIPEPESIADHMYRMACMAMVLAPMAGANVGRCVKMALVHDAPEALVGDITPHCGVSKEEKHQLEKDAVERIKGILGGSTAAGLEFESLWWEYEGASTPEAHLVKDIDKLELILQAYQYEMMHKKDLQEFFDSTAGKFKTQVVQAVAQEVCSRRNKALADAGVEVSVVAA